MGIGTNINGLRAFRPKEALIKSSAPSSCRFIQSFPNRPWKK